MAPVQEIEDNTSCPVGASKRLECQVIGLPRPSVRWYKDGVNITTNKRYQFEYTPDGCVVLVLENVTAKDQGVYSCRAQNSEGSAETVAQLYIKGTMSEAGGDTPSIHTMPLFKKVENENEMTSQSQKRPLVIGKSTDSNNEPQSVHEEAADMKDNESFSEGEEKGTLETKQQKHAKKYDTGDEKENACSESDEDTQKNDELSNVVDDLLELTKFGNSGRRLTTDSGITSRGSSFSSEPDINITEESIQEMKEYLHGKADALYQPFEHDKVKDIKESETEIVIARSEKLASNEKAEHVKSQIMSMTSLRQEKYDTDRVNEIEASVLAGMYLFDTGPSGKVDECRHGIPALELLVRKEALEAIPDNERGNGKFYNHDADSIEHTEKEKSHTRLEYQTAEIIQESGNGENNKVEILNAINIEKNSEAVRIHDEVKCTKIKTVRYVEEGEEGIEKSSGGQENLNTLAGVGRNDNMSLVHDKYNQDTEILKKEKGKMIDKNKKTDKELEDKIKNIESDRDCINADTCENKENRFLSANNITEQEIHAETTTAFKDKDINTDEIHQGILSESNKVKYFGDIEGVLEDENKMIEIETVKYVEESEKGNEKTSGDQENLSTLAEVGRNDKMSLEHGKCNQDTEILNKEEEKGIDKSKQDMKTDKEVEDELNTNQIDTDADFVNTSSKDAMDQVDVISSSSDVYNDDKRNDDKDNTPNVDAESKQSVPKNKEDNQNTADKQCKSGQYLESDTDIINAETGENKGNRLLSVDNIAKAELHAETTTAFMDKDNATHEICQDNLSELIKVKYFGDIEGVLEDENKRLEIETVKYIEKSWKGKEETSGDEENLSTLAEVGHNVKMSLENDKYNQDAGILKTEEEKRIDKSRRDSKTDKELEAEIITNLIDIDADIASASSEDAVDKVNIMSSSSNINNDEKTNDEKDYRLEIDAESITSAPKNREDNQNTANNQSEIGKNLESDRDIINADTCENKVNRFLSADNTAEDAFGVDTTTVFNEKDITTDEICQGSLSGSLEVKCLDDVEGVLEHEKTEMVEIETVRYVEKGEEGNDKTSDGHENLNILSKVGHGNEMVESDRSLARGGSFDHNDVQNETSSNMRKPEISGLLDHEQADGSEGRIKASKDQSVSDDSREIDKRQGYEDKNHVKQEPEITDKSNGLQIEDPTSTVTDSETRAKDKNSFDFEVGVAKKKSNLANSVEMIAHSSIDSLDENIKDSSVEVDSGVDMENEEAKAKDDKDKRLASGVHNVGNLITNGSSETELVFSTKTSSTEHGANIADIDVVKKVVTDDAELRPIEENFEMKSSQLQELALNGLNARKNKSIETHLSENSENVDESVVAVENESRQHGAELKQHDKVNKRIAVLRKSKETMLYSADENSDSGREFSEPLKDIDLVRIEDTKPQVPNIINIQDKMKQKEIKTKDASLTEEIENRVMSLKDMSEDPSIISAKQTTATNSLLVVSADEINLAPWELIRIESTRMVQDEEFEMIRSKHTIEEINEASVKTDSGDEGGKELLVNKILDKEAKVSEHQILPQKANTDSEVIHLDKLNNADFAEVGEVSKQQVIPEGTHKESKDDETIIIGSKYITGEISEVSAKMDVGEEGVKELVVNKIFNEEAEVSELQILPEKAHAESKVSDLDKLNNADFAEIKHKVTEQQVIPENTHKECKVPDLENLCHSEKVTHEPDKTLQNNASSHKVDEECIVPESVNKDNDTPDISKTDKLKEKTSEPKKYPTEGKSEPTVEVLLDDTNVRVNEGFPVKLRWKIRGVALSEVNICKSGQKVEISDNLHVDILNDVISLIVDSVTISDEATYSIRIHESEKDHGEVRLKVHTSVSSIGKESTVPEEPQFVVEPVVDVEYGRRLSIKCSVTGFPAPEVTWYCHGQQLGQDALWEIYSKDGYHYLGVGDPSVLDCEEIVCRVENHLGYVQRVVRVKRDGDEVYCEPVLPPVSPEPSEVTESSPSIEIDISEIVTANLRKLPLAEDYTDRLNFVTLNAGDIVEVLACEAEGTVLARKIPEKDRVCYIPIQALTVSDDVSSQVCENAAIKNNIRLTEQQLHQNKEEATMPERRKMKSPSPKMTSTPKMKRKEVDTESTEELQKRLGFSDNLAQKKEFSTKDSVEFTEYNDGTTRPMFKKRLKSVTAKSGEMAQLECTVSGSPLPKILWLKNNRPLKASDSCKVIVDEDTNILVFPQAREDDVGIYTARAMNVNGSIMCSAEFTLSDGRGVPAQPVTDSPMDLDFTTPAYFFQMSSCEVTEGGLARFDCRVVAFPKPQIVWIRDGKVVESGERFKLLNFNNEVFSLLIRDVQMEDTGRYECLAKNKFGEAMTETYLTVKALTEQEPDGDLAPKFLTRFYDQQTTEGIATDFRCLIAGRPEPSVTWLLDDLEIREEKGVKMRHKDGMVSLEIKSPQVDQSGTYTCQLNNPLGEATCSARLTVVEDKLHGKMLPKFLKKFDHVTAKEGEEAKFTSVIVGEPRPDVMWLFDHKPISDTNRRFQMKKEGDAYTLIIKNVRFDDGGKITCKASNEEGEVYCSANLHVRESKYMRDMPEKTGVKGQDELDSKFGYIPTFTKRLQDLEVKEGSKATFECKVMGIPDPEISWMKDGRVISPGGRHHMTLEGGTGQLVIDNVTAADTGVYTCIVSNSQGKSSSTAALKLEEPKKERYTPDRLLEERTSRKERYTPERYLLDDSTSSKRPYLDTDRYDKYDKYDAKVKKSYESPLASTKLEESYVPRSKKKYDSPKSSYDSYKPKYDTSYESPKLSFESPKLSYETPLRQYDSTYARLESPVRQFDTYKRYESPVRQYEGVSTRYESPIRPYESISTRYESPVRQYEGFPSKYESPVRPYESASTRYESPIRQYEGISTKYESPIRPYESISTRYESPVRTYESPRGLYESPRRRSSVGREERIKAVPKIPFDRPALLNKREDSVQLSWLPAPTYDLPDDARHISYVVESREVPSGDWTKVASSVPGTSYTIRHLRPDKEYEFRVRAQNQHGASEPTWNATLDKRVDETSKQLDLPEMRAPPRLPTHRPIITDLGEETLRLAWRPVETYQSKRTPPVSYRLEAKQLPGKDWMPLSSRLRDTTHYLSELPHDRDYMIRVRAENDFGISEPTEPLWLPRATAFPGVPVTRPEIIDYEDTRAKLSWSRVDIPAFGMDDAPLLYMLEVEEPPHKDWRTVARDLDDTEYIVEGLRPGHDYRFRVRAKTPTGIVSEPSPAVSLYTKLAQTRAPVDRLEILEYEPDSRSVNLSWDRVNIPPYNLDDEPLMYMLEYQEPPLPEWKTLVTGIPTTRYRVMHLDRERDYNFRVRALTPYGVSPPSPAVPVTMRQTPVTRGLPEKVIISEVEPHSLRLTWRRPMYDLDKPISYQVEMLEYPFSDWRPIASRVVETTYKVTGLKPTRDYQFRVIPQVDSGYLAPSPSAALTTMPVKPRLPYTEPKLKELTPESVQLSWGLAETPAYQRKRSPIHYKVEMAELPSSNWVPVARKVPDTTFNVTGLRANQEYKFRVFAESDSGLSEPSMPVTLYRKPAPKFNLKEPSIRDISQNIVHLAWTPAEVPDSAASASYMVEMQTPPGISTWSVLHRKHPSPSVRLADLRPDLDYLVRVRAQSGSYLSEPTLPVYIPRRAAPPRLPVEEPYAVDINADYVKLQWRSAELPTHIQDYAPISYRLEAQELPDTNWVAIARGIPHTDFKVTGLNPQRDYNFRVRAENEYGLSDPTHPMMLRKRSVAPVMPISEPLLYDVGSGSARLSWRPASYPSFVPSQSPITYTLFVQELPFKTWRPLVKRIPHTSYYVSGLQPDKEYRFRVQAENQFGSSKPTESVLLPQFKDFTRPISVPEVSDFDEDLTSVKLRWSPTRVSPPFDTTPRKYTVETWEPIRREWKPVARGVPDTTYQIRELPKLPDHLFRVRMDTEEPTLSEPSLPVSLSRYRLPRAPMYRPQLYEVDDDSVRLSWQPVHVPEGVSRRSVRYIIEQREIPEPHWSPVATDIMETSYKVRGLRPKYDYEFRVKAMYDGTSTEPSYPVSLFRRAVIPKVKFDAPEVYDVEDSSLSLRWNTVDVPAFTNDEEPLLFVIERQTLPSYEWQPVATNITDKTYTVRDLQPYQDYNFRVRGVYPSGYTEPSPYVPVYRRPSESKIGLVGLESSTLEFKIYGSQKYFSKPEISQTLPTQKLHATVPATELSPITKKAIETRLRSYVKAPDRRYSVANIYDTRELYSKEAHFTPEPTVPTPEVRFKLENAYVYKRSRSPVKVELPTTYDTMKAGEYKKMTPKKENDLYEWYRQLHRRYSDVGIEELTKRRSRKSQFLQEKLLEERRTELILEAQQRRLAKRGSVPSVQTKAPHVVRPTEPSVRYPSVADRYEDIKCPFIVSPGHWRFARRHSVALDWEDLQRLQRQLEIESKKLETKLRSRSEMPKTYKPKYDFISQSQAEYFGGTYFHIEDQLNFNDMRPRIPRVDLTSPYVRRSLSQERDPGYFMISKFSLSVAGVKRPASRATQTYVRPASLEPSPVARLPRRYRSYTPEYKSYTPEYTPEYRSYTPEYRSYTPDYRSLKSEYRSYTPEYRSYTPEYRSYSPEQRSLPKTRSLTPDLYYKSRSETPEYRDFEKLKQKSTSLAQELARAKLYDSGYRSVSRSSTERSERQMSPVKPVRRPSPPRQKEAFVKPRSYSVSVPRAEMKKFNRIIEDSKSLIGNYERLDERSRAASIAKATERTGSVADIRSDPRFSSTPRGSMSGQQSDVRSDPRYTSTPRGSVSTQHGDVRSDPRYSRTRRSSVTMSQAEREKLASISAIKSDARFSSHRRATIATNEDLKSKLDTLNSALSVPKPKKRKSSRPVIKFKSSRGEGAL